MRYYLKNTSSSLFLERIVSNTHCFIFFYWSLYMYFISWSHLQYVKLHYFHCAAEARKCQEQLYSSIIFTIFIPYTLSHDSDRVLWYIVQVSFCLSIHQHFVSNLLSSIFMNFLKLCLSIYIGEECFFWIENGEILLTFNRVMTLGWHQNFVSIQYFGTNECILIKIYLHIDID